MNIERIECPEIRAEIIREFTNLNEQIKFFEALSNAGIDQMISFDTNKQISFCNKTCADLRQIDKDAVVGELITDVLPVFKENEHILAATQYALLGFKMFVPHEKGTHNGTYYEHHLIPLKDETENVTGVLVIIYDAAPRIIAEQQLQQLNKELQKKNKELKVLNNEVLAFAHMAGHDLKEPLHKIYNFMEIILRDEARNFTDKGRNYFKRVQIAAQRMGLLTDDMLAFAELNIEKSPKTMVDLNRTLAFAKNSLRTQITNKDAEIVADELPTVQGFTSLLSQLFQHILSNALKFQSLSATPKIDISCMLLDGEHLQKFDAPEVNKYCAISFTDNGIGFEQRYAESIFNMFQRLQPDSFAGNGMGLAVCKKICELHNGFIEARSEPGSGSTFICYLPVLQ